jgi:hypothetical protein
MENFRTTGKMDSAYQAALRSACLADRPPTYRTARYCPEKMALLHPPVVKNLDRLMRWILMVSGCIPATGEYRFDVEEDTYKLSTFIDRPQYRTENPLHTTVLDTFENMCQEAMARCVLFTNPGCYDVDFVWHYKEPLNVLQRHIIALKKTIPNANGAEEARYQRAALLNRKPNGNHN